MQTGYLNTFTAFMKYWRYLTVVALGMLLAWGCREAPEQPVWDVDAYLPLVTSELRLQDALEDSLIETANDSSLRLVYRGTLFSYKIDSLFTIPDTSTEEFVQLPFGTITFQPGQDIVNDTQDTRYDLDDIQLQEAIVLSGSMIVELSSTISENTIFTYTLPFVTLNGSPFTLVENVPAGSIPNPITLTRTLDLTGYTLDLRGIDRNRFNTLVTVYKATVDPNGNPVTITGGDFVRIRNTFSAIVPQYARGYFGSTIETDDSEEATDIFNSLPMGDLNVEQISLDFTIKNEAGADLQVTINELTSINTNQNTTVPLSSSLIGQQVNLNRAQEGGTNTPPIIPSVYTTSFDSSNSNVTDFVSNLPNRFGFDFTYQINPLGNVSNGNDFIYFDKGLDLELDAEIPLFLSARNLILVDTADLDVDDDSREDTDRINGGRLLLYASNHYPVDAFVQFYLLDEDFNVLDSLFAAPTFLQAGRSDVDGRVVAPSFNTLPIPLTPARINTLYASTYTVLRASLTTTDYPQPVRFFDSYFIGLTLVGDFNYRVDFPEN